MVSLFDEVLSVVALRGSLAELANRVGAQSSDAVQAGVVLSAAVAIAGVADNVDRYGPDAVHEQLANVAPLPEARPETLASLGDLDRLGNNLLQLTLDARRQPVGIQIADRTALPMASAERTLTISAGAVAALLANRGHDKAALPGVLHQERQRLVDYGLEPWITSLRQTDESIDRLPPVSSPGTRSSPQHPPVVDARPEAPRPAPPERRPITPAPAAAAAAAAAPAAVRPTAIRTAAEVEVDRPERAGPLRWLLLALPIIAIAGLAVAYLLTTGNDGTDLTTEGAADTSTTVEAPPSEGPDSTLGQSTVTEAPADSQTVELELTLDDPLGRTTGTGTADLAIDPTTGRICFDFELDGIGSPYDGHIHVGPAGVKGGIVVDFGVLDGATIGCLDGNPVDIQAIIADPAGHYVEFHDPDGTTTVREQLAEALGDPVYDSGSDPDTDGGAFIAIESGALVLRGQVPDQTTREKLVESFADIDLGDTEIRDETEILAGAPRPSGTIVVGDDVLFEYDSDQLANTDSTVLADVATIFKARPAWRMVIVGHTDNQGADAYNLELSLRRASAVRDQLVAAGVSDELLSIRGAGATDPVVANDTEEQRAQNRRIEFEITPG